MDELDDLEHRDDVCLLVVRIDLERVRSGEVRATTGALLGQLGGRPKG